LIVALAAPVWVTANRVLTVPAVNVTKPVRWFAFGLAAVATVMVDAPERPDAGVAVNQAESDMAVQLDWLVVTVTDLEAAADAGDHDVCDSVIVGSATVPPWVTV
jgi:hypothetical protein